MNSQSVDNGTKTLTAVLFGAVLLVALLLALAVTFGAVSQASLSANGADYTTNTSSETGWANSTGYTLNKSSADGFRNPSITSLRNSSDAQLKNGETGAFINSTGYTLKGSNIFGFTSPVIVAAYNATDDTLIGAGNYTLVGYSLKNTTDTNWDDVKLNYTWTNTIGVGNVSVTQAGVVKNTTVASFNGNLVIGYSYQYDTTSANNLNTNLDTIKADIVGMVDNFFSLMPTVGTILAVVILISAIVLLVLYVVRAKNSGSGSSSGEYYG